MKMFRVIAVNFPQDYNCVNSSKNIFNQANLNQQSCSSLPNQCYIDYSLKLSFYKRTVHKQTYKQIYAILIFFQIIKKTYVYKHVSKNTKCLCFAVSDSAGTIRKVGYYSVEKSQFQARLKSFRESLKSFTSPVPFLLFWMFKIGFKWKEGEGCIQ